MSGQWCWIRLLVSDCGICLLCFIFVSKRRPWTAPDSLLTSGSEVAPQPGGCGINAHVCLQYDFFVCWFSCTCLGNTQLMKKYLMQCERRCISFSVSSLLAGWFFPPCISLTACVFLSVFLWTLLSLSVSSDRPSLSPGCQLLLFWLERALFSDSGSCFLNLPQNTLCWAQMQHRGRTNQNKPKTGTKTRQCSTAQIDSHQTPVFLDRQSSKHLLCDVSSWSWCLPVGFDKVHLLREGPVTPVLPAALVLNELLVVLRCADPKQNTTEYKHLNILIMWPLDE